MDGLTASPVDSPAARAYLERTVQTWLGLPAGTESAAPELPAELARLLLRLEEHEHPHRSSYGLWEHGFSENFRTGRLLVPELDEWLAERRRELARDVSLEPLWPDDAPFAACLTHDVDVISRRSTPRQALRQARSGLAGAGSLPLRLARPPVRLARAVGAGIGRTPSTEDVLEASVAVEAEAGVTASYFFTVQPAGPRSRYDCAYGPGDPCRFRGRRQTVADVARTLAAEGFDVGLHGSIGAADRPGALAREREALARATGLDVTTTRQHFLRWDVRATPRLQAEAGFGADSSLGFNRSAGFRAGTSLPFRVFDVPSGEQLRLLEVPLVVQDGALLGEYGLELDLDLALLAVQRVVDAVARVGGLVTFLFHPDNLERPHALDLYRRTVATVVERGAWVASVAGVEAWWSEREARLGLA